jgi:hypothetical protein
VKGARRTSGGDVSTLKASWGLCYAALWCGDDCRQILRCAGLRLLPAAGTPVLVRDETRSRVDSKGCLGLDLRSEPDAELQDPLELFGVVVPAVVVAD